MPMGSKRLLMAISLGQLSDCLRPAHAVEVVGDFDLSGHKTQPTRSRCLGGSLADEGFEVAPNQCRHGCAQLRRPNAGEPMGFFIYRYGNVFHVHLLADAALYSVWIGR